MNLTPNAFTLLASATFALLALHSHAAVSDFTRTDVADWNGREGVTFVRWFKSGTPRGFAYAFVVNNSPIARPVAFDFGGRKPKSCRIVDGTRTDVEIEFPSALPPHSFLLVEFGCP